MALQIRIIILVAFAFVMNVPLGYLRQATRKFSFKWFLYIHLSIPFIILIRLGLGISYWFVPFSIGSAVAGQVMGARLRRPT
jgi:ABC-type methionine transport system permease subunit